jgi:hypothetical protein
MVIPTIFVLIISVFARKTILVDPETTRSRPIVLYGRLCCSDLVRRFDSIGILAV